MIYGLAFSRYRDRCFKADRFGFGKKYTEEDLQREINVLDSLYLC